MKSQYSLVRKLDRFYEEWDKGNDGAARVHLEGALALEADPQLAEEIKSAHEARFPGDHLPLRTAYAKFKKRYRLSLLCSKALNLLSLVEPVVVNHVKSRNVNPEKKGNIAHDIQAVLSTEYDGLDELSKFRRLVKLQNKAIGGLKNGKTSSKLNEEIARLKQELNI